MGVFVQSLNASVWWQASTLFSELTAAPVAAASLGQVYRGRLASTGEEVGAFHFDTLGPLKPGCTAD